MPRRDSFSLQPSQGWRQPEKSVFSTCGASLSFYWTIFHMPASAYLYGDVLPPPPFFSPPWRCCFLKFEDVLYWLLPFISMPFNGRHQRHHCGSSDNTWSTSIKWPWLKKPVCPSLTYLAHLTHIPRDAGPLFPPVYKHQSGLGKASEWQNYILSRKSSAQNTDEAATYILFASL